MLPPSRPVETDNNARAERVIKSSPRIAVFVLGGLVVIFGIINWCTSGTLSDFFARIGQLGDVTGGITGPILNFAGMLIVYYSLREQLQANNIQNQALSIQNTTLQLQLNEVAVNSLRQLAEVINKELIKQQSIIQRQIDLVEDFLRPSGGLAIGNFKAVATEKVAAIQGVSQGLSELAGLLNMGIGRVRQLPVDAPDRLYAINLFYQSCIAPLEQYSYIKERDLGFTDNLELIMNLRDKYKEIRDSAYLEAIRLSQ